MIKELLNLVNKNNASDLHIVVNEPPILRIDGELTRTDFAPLSADETKSLCHSLLTEDHRKHLEQEHEVDCAYGIENLGRFRINVYKDRLGYNAALRTIPSHTPTFDDLQLPPIVKETAKLPRGLVLVTGPTGSGKSTTLSAMVDWINEHRSEHIITVEDPIEFIHKSKKSVINQREIGADTHNFANALRASLREDPDVILIGEMRDLETISLAIRAAETGHLVFGTLHTSSAASTIDRIIDVFPSEQQTQVRIQLSNSLQAVFSQTLLPLKTGKGRTMAMETMIITPAIANLVRESKTSQIYSAIQTGRQVGMQTLEASLADLYKRDIVRLEDVIARTSKLDELRNLIGAAAGEE